jgi:hypothetical protein
VRQPLSVRAGCLTPRRRRGRGDREHRHRRPHDDPRGRQELRVHDPRGAPRELRRGARRAPGHRRHAVDADAGEPRRRGVRVHRPLRHGDREVVRGEERRLPGAVRARVREGRGPALRREPAPAGRLLLAGRRAYARAVDGAPAPRQAAVVQQHPRPGFGASPRVRVRRGGVRHRQAQQPVRLRDRRLRARRLPASLRVRPVERVRRRHRRATTTTRWRS